MAGQRRPRPADAWRDGVGGFRRTSAGTEGTCIGAETQYTGSMNENNPSADYDSPWKLALARYLPEALALFFPDVHAGIDWTRGYQLLDKELQQVTRDADIGRRLADLLVKVWRHDGSDVWVLIHLEVQGTPDPQFPQRMFVYYYRIFDRYQCPVLSLALLADERADWRPDRFEQTLLGCTASLHYPIVKLLDWRSRRAELEASDNPFAVVLLAHLAAQETRERADARGQAKLALIRGLYQRGFTREDVLELLRLLDWLLALPEALEREVWRAVEALEKEGLMPYVTSYERMYEERFKEIGKAIGEEIGESRARSRGDASCCAG